MTLDDATALEKDQAVATSVGEDTVGSSTPNRCRVGAGWENPYL